MAPAGARLEDLVRAGVAQWTVRALVRDELPETSLPALLATLTPRHLQPRFARIPSATRTLLRGTDAVAARVIGPGTCLFRSLARYAALRQARVDARFVIGVAPSPVPGEDFVAHAWIEVGGEPVFEPSPPRYSETFCWPERTR